MSAALVLLGVLSPLELPIIDTANFAGYILWSGWLVALGVLILRRPRVGDPRVPGTFADRERSPALHR